MDAVAKLLAMEEIKQLKARYFRYQDWRDWEGMATVFCRDAVFDCTEGSIVQTLHDGPDGQIGPMKHGREEIMAWIVAAFANRCSIHHGHCHEITIDSGTEAHGVIAMEDMIYAPDRKTLLIHAAGHYQERYRVEDGEWRIAFVKLTRLMRMTPGV